jgi:DNA-binding XRE family transcriptional regulator
LNADSDTLDFGVNQKPGFQIADNFNGAARMIWMQYDAGDHIVPQCATMQPKHRHRGNCAMTQAALAEKAGVNRVTVAEIETSRKQGSIATLRALANALGVSLDDLA